MTDQESVLSEYKPPSIVPASGLQRVLYALVVTILPLVAFLAGNLFSPSWQSGESSDYLGLLLNSKTTMLFSPLLAYAVVALLLLITSDRFAARFSVRLGVYTGVVLALQYVVLLALLAPMSLAAATLLVAFYLLVKVLHRRFGRSVILPILLGMGILPIMLGMRILGIGLHLEFFDYVLLMMGISPFLSAPALCFLIMLLTALQLLRAYEVPLTLTRTAAILAWLSGYAAAWVFSIEKMYTLYAALPEFPPGS